MLYNNAKKSLRGYDMLFRKKMQRCCEYCRNGTKFGEDQILCFKKGVMPLYGKCRKFQYDPCKRIPPKPKAMDFLKYNDTDFTL